MEELKHMMEMVSKVKAPEMTVCQVNIPITILTVDDEGVVRIQGVDFSTDLDLN